jgi:hypothetical protein
MGVFTRMMAGLAAEADLSKTIMIGATFPEGAPHGFSPRAKKGARAAHRAHEGWAEHKAPRRCG